MFENLPVEIISLITEDLDAGSLLNFSLTSKEHYSIALENLRKRKEFFRCSDLSDVEIENEIKLENDKFRRGVLLKVKEYRRKIDLTVIKSMYLEVPSYKGRLRLIRYYHDIKDQELWFLDGQIHRPENEGPAVTAYYSDGRKMFEQWWLHNLFHRIKGPARIGYYENGKKKYEEYLINGRFQYGHDYAKWS